MYLPTYKCPHLDVNPVSISVSHNTIPNARMSSQSYVQGSEPCPLSHQSA